jgi:hypothetical protein
MPRRKLAPKRVTYLAFICEILSVECDHASQVVAAVAVADRLDLTGGVIVTQREVVQVTDDRKIVRSCHFLTFH